MRLGLGLSPEAPPAPPAPGGRAPSFGANRDAGAWALRLGGRIQGGLSVGIGRRGEPQHPGQSSTPLHRPPETQGKLPPGIGTGLSLALAYGNSRITAHLSYDTGRTGKEYEGRFNATTPRGFSQAYLSLTPEPLGGLHLQAKVGGFMEAFAGVGQWGWGVFGPLIGTRGYGETLSAEYDLSPTVRLFAAHGVSIVPAVDEFFVRGTYTSWNETGVSTLLHHGHLGFGYADRATVKLHAVNAIGIDERRFLSPVDARGESRRPRDGEFSSYALETHFFADQYGQLGAAAAYYVLDQASAVHDGIFWAVDWTQGSREMTAKFLGPNSGATGRLLALSAEYDLSVAQLLWHPRAFDGRAPDLRVALAGLYHRTLESDDPVFEADGASGFMAGLELDYRMLPWFSATLHAYGEERDTAPILARANDATGEFLIVARSYAHTERFRAYSVTPGVSFRRDWTAPERLFLAYSLRFYSDAADHNPLEPLDRQIVTLGASLDF